MCIGTIHRIDLTSVKSILPQLLPLFKNIFTKQKTCLFLQAGLLLSFFFKRRENEKVCVVLVVVCLYNTTFFDLFQLANYTKIIKTSRCFCALFTIFPFFTYQISF